MDSQRPPAAITTPTSSRRKQHQPSSSLGSLYEVLADLDENQLYYLVQEMNHTGHQNVPVSQAVSAFESQNPTDSLNTVRASMMPTPVQGMQRQLSKSQRGKLRLQSALQRAPSLRQKPREEDHGAAQLGRNMALQTPKLQPTHDHVDMLEVSTSNPIQVSVIDEPDKPAILPPRQEVIADAGTLQPLTDARRKSPAYRRIPRPDFSLPPGVTVTDLLQLLEIEFLSSDSQQPSTPTSLSSPSSAFSTHLSPSPLLLSPSSSIILPQTPESMGARPLRRHTSRLDMALDAERTASGVQEIGLAMLEPRPQATTPLGTSASSSPTAFVDSFDRLFKGETPPPPATPVVLEGIFDVLENR